MTSFVHSTDGDTHTTKSSDETDGARSRSLLQMRDSWLRI